MPYGLTKGEVPPMRHAQIPHPGGSLYTEELTVMIDTVTPLDLGRGTRDSEDDGSAWTWLEGR